MPATATLTVTATTGTIRRVLDLLDAETREGSVVVTPPGGPPDDRLAAFARVLTPLGRPVVRAIAEASQSGEVVARQKLPAVVAIGQTPGPSELNGALGTAGVRWNRLVGTANPFRGRVDPALRDRVHGVDPPPRHLRPQRAASPALCRSRRRGYDSPAGWRRPAGAALGRTTGWSRSGAPPEAPRPGRRRS
jgi:hypothetical protein